MISEVRPPIETSALAKRFGSVRALDGMDLTVHAGEVHGFLGPNGAGKTTTLHRLLSAAPLRRGPFQQTPVVLETNAELHVTSTYGRTRQSLRSSSPDARARVPAAADLGP
jgi:ABC-type branched-subunit amino acid transport system ATPase component